MHRLRTVTYLDVSAVAGHHAMPAALLFFLNYMKCSFFRYYMCVFDINLFILNEDLFICQQPTPVASNTDALKITPIFAS